MPEVEVKESNLRQRTIKERLLYNADKAEKFAARRNPNAGTMTTVVMRASGKRMKRPKVFAQSLQYNFLQYIRIVYKWAIANHELKETDIDLLHYLNPIGIFSKNDFHFFHRTIGLYGDKTLERLIDAGWIVQWRERKGREKALFTLSEKGKMLCSRMHKMCTGEEEIPVTRRNKMVTDKTKVINNYYLRVIAEMNKKAKAPTEK